MKKILSLMVIALVASAVTIGAYEYLELGKQQVIIEKTESTPAYRYVDNAVSSNGLADFTTAAELSTPSVVHIISTKVSTYNSYDPWRELFGDDFFGGAPQNPKERRQQSSGSGVIISEDGYIVTNNHVVSAADEVEITLFNKESYVATVIGTDPTTDLALLKIDAENLPRLKFANSDDVRIGEWVMAVGNPFNLESTVTAGIVSAKGRNINILRDQYSIESFIQTDAAVNPGNSGGALVDLSGNLIGINTAIATPTGVYAGYSFAVPANIVNKVCEDLKNYGMVQRGFLGVMIKGVDSRLADEFDLDVSSGVYIDNLVEDGAAAEAGIEKGDVIIEIDDHIVQQFDDIINYLDTRQVDDIVTLTVIRDGEPLEIP
ncbi:MAG: S1C family serine protease, partial [Bacteroidia bacterium]